MDLQAARRALLAWYDRHGRDLPWRRTRDPYAVWVSEVMLQQTRVATVIPYYERFMRRFPNVAALAAADEDQVLSHWSGLGYYRRARLLHKGAREVARRYGGRLPEDAEARRALPGIGRYTAGAIGSIAFDLPEPVVDGNVARVLCRWLGIDTPIGARPTEERLWRAAGELAPGPRPGDLNQAVMELGAVVCTPSTPDCERCPVSSGCYARRQGLADRLPVPRARKAPAALPVVAVLASPPGAPEHCWLARGEGGLFGGLWGCPMAEGQGRERARELAREHGLRGGRLSAEPVASLRHELTHRVMRVEVYRLRGARAPADGPARAVCAAELTSLGVSALTRKILSQRLAASSR